MQVRRRKVLAALSLVAALGFATPALADAQGEEDSGHPLRIAAYLLHPIGVLIDTLITRPAHWLVHRESLQTLFGHTD